MSKYDFISEVDITRIKGKNRLQVKDLTAREVELTIAINDRKIIILNCSPGNYKYLAIGFLYTSGIITKKEDIISIKIDKNIVNIKLNRQLIKEENLIKPHLQIGFSKSKTEKILNKLNKQGGRSIKSETIFSLLARMQKKAHWFDKTGGVHSCALADREGSLLLFCEDVSRYNTIDRIFGEALYKNIIVEDKILLTSCRITAGIMRKIIKGGMVAIASRSAVTDTAIALANEKGITLIGFARDNRMNIYSGPENIMN